MARRSHSVRIDVCGALQRLPEPYPGSNFFSLASGGAGYVADPQRTLVADQLNGAEFTPFTRADWDVLRPHLAENARLFSLPPDALTHVDGRVASPFELYRKVVRTQARFKRNLLGT